MYFKNLQDSLFKNMKDKVVDSKEVHRTQHCCFYDIIHLDREYPSRKSFLKQMVREITLKILDFQKAGLVHGQITSHSIEYKMKRGKSPQESDKLTDLIITNTEYSYEF